MIKVGHTPLTAGGWQVQIIGLEQKLQQCYELLKEIDEWDYVYPLSTQHRLDLMLCELGKKFERVE